VSNIQYQDTLYPFISAGEEPVTGTALLVVDSQFKNLMNVQISTTLAQVMVQNTSFENIDMDRGAFLVLYTRPHPNVALRMLNTSLM